ncbi:MULTISPECIES: hypothetical protein [Bacillus]|uniref:Uncharacterized protein n=1 Tax=Bacillus infantis NRRL B-14911 TaxID=1367477 RepID=U5LH06_9BACI|nr:MULTISPECIES: hypothetical protein [Bacillus]AGX06750.1 hypothetical protein N288_24585 [Bacillus infantis NRRL B-14911]PLR73307.1 hypothetical protein CYJ37_07085 [Bacillus sp. UMB0728]
MAKNVTFSFDTKYINSRTCETFTFEELGVAENLNEEAERKILEDILQAWIWDKLNISYSIVLNKDE